MLIPRFTIRWLLGLMVVAAFISLILAQAVQGQAWALGTMIGLASFALVFLAHASVFMVAWIFVQIRRVLQTAPTATSPFASSGPPRQIVPPVGTE